MENEQKVTARHATPKVAAQAQVAAFRKDMSEGWGWQRTAELQDWEARLEKMRRDGVPAPVDAEAFDKSRALRSKYPTAEQIEWCRGGGPSQYVIELGPLVRIAGQLGESNALDSARIEHQNESTGWVGLPLDNEDQQAVNDFVRRLLML